MVTQSITLGSYCNLALRHQSVWSRKFQHSLLNVYLGPVDGAPVHLHLGVHGSFSFSMPHAHSMLSWDYVSTLVYISYITPMCKYILYYITDNRQVHRVCVMSSGSRLRKQHQSTHHCQWVAMVPHSVTSQWDARRTIGCVPKLWQQLTIDYLFYRIVDHFAVPIYTWPIMITRKNMWSMDTIIGTMDPYTLQVDNYQSICEIMKDWFLSVGQPRL